MAHAASLIDLGGSGPVLHLSPANGFPPATYRQFASALWEWYRIVALTPRPLWPGSQPSEAPTWRHLAADLIQGLDELHLRPAAGVGHSIGGVLTLWAAVQRPELFRAVVLIDPVILPPSWLRYLRLMQLSGLWSKQPLVQATLKRRQRFPSRQQCFDLYRRKALFARWPDASLWDYVEAATTPSADGGFELLYPPTWEAHIFATTPTDIWRDVPRLRMPALVIRGELSSTFRQQAQARMARLLPHARFEVIPDAGHLVPMEQPARVASVVRRFLRDVGC